jgi:murein DD-endopeptidase MepM/ murein hydrolase activator NlpD
LKRVFLRSPLRFTPRVTSGFSRRRLHPVHRVYRPHLGVDYGAPRGAPVVAVANGRVVSAGYSGASGLMVRLRHSNGFESYYLHLSSLGKGIRRGARVDQGQMIGRVGSTGTATGAHLDYRLKQNGVFVNPLTVHRRMPPGDPIARDLRAAYDTERARLTELMSTTLLARASQPVDDTVKPAAAAAQ